jgi:hypothetical protein
VGSVALARTPSAPSDACRALFGAGRPTSSTAGRPAGFVLPALKGRLRRVGGAGPSAVERARRRPPQTRREPALARPNLSGAAN